MSNVIRVYSDVFEIASNWLCNAGSCFVYDSFRQ
jgi:hypothetical protein